MEFFDKGCFVFPVVGERGDNGGWGGGGEGRKNRHEVAEMIRTRWLAIILGKVTPGLGITSNNRNSLVLPNILLLFSIVALVKRINRLFRFHHRLLLFPQTLLVPLLDLGLLPLAPLTNGFRVFLRLCSGSAVEFGAGEDGGVAAWCGGRVGSGIGLRWVRSEAVWDRLASVS